MKNFVQRGKILDYLNLGSDISSGDVVVLGDRIAVAVNDIPSNSIGSVSIAGVYELASDTGTAYSQGDNLYWDASNSRLTKTASGNVRVGICTEAKASATAKANVTLDSQPQRATFVPDASSGSAAEINAIRDALVNAGLMKSS